MRVRLEEGEGQERGKSQVSWCRRATLEQRAEQMADELMKRPAETSLDEHQIRTLDEITDRLLKEA